MLCAMPCKQGVFREFTGIRGNRHGLAPILCHGRASCVDGFATRGSPRNKSGLMAGCQNSRRFRASRAAILNDFFPSMVSGRRHSIGMIEINPALQIRFQETQYVLSSEHQRRRKQVQGSLAFVLVFDANRHSGLSRQRRRFARSRLQARFLIRAQHHLMCRQLPRVQRADVLHSSAEVSIARHVRRLGGSCLRSGL
jgi:hypothetical protein